MLGKPGSGVYVERLTPPQYIKMQPLRGIQVAENILRNCKSGRTLIYFDPDTDGLVAGLFFAKVLDHLGVEYETYVNSNREHGFQLKGEDYKGWTILNGDFLVTEEQAIDLVSHDVSLLSIDHHECQEGMIHFVKVPGDVLPGYMYYLGRGISQELPPYQGTAEAIVINNQYPFEDERNKFQSGAGVTFQVLREIFPFLDTEYNRALVGVTLITDVRDIEAEGAHAWLYESYHCKYEGEVQRLISSLIKDKPIYTFGTPRLDRSFISYTMSPKLNSLFRFNLEELAVDYILGHGYPSEDYQAKQKSLVKVFKERAQVREFKNVVFVRLNGHDYDTETYSYLSNFVGLVASNFTDRGKSVIAWSTDYTGQVVRASFRGVVVSARYRELLEEVIDGRGHNIAFGIKDFVPTASLCAKIDEIVGIAEDSAKSPIKYIEERSLDTFKRSYMSIVAERNEYLLEQNQVYIKYTGGTYKTVADGARMQKYNIGGVIVTSFDSSLSPTKDLILPYMNKGDIHFTLAKKFDENNALLEDRSKHLKHKDILV